MNRSLFSSQSCLWNTPRDLYDKLNAEFNFNDDPCPEGGVFGLDREWGTRTYCNPPYGRYVGEWIEKGIKESWQRKIVVFLLPARTDTKWFHELILPNAKEIRFIKGRLRFQKSNSSVYHLEHKNSAPFPSMIVIFKDD